MMGADQLDQAPCITVAARSLLILSLPVCSVSLQLDMVSVKCVCNLQYLLSSWLVVSFQWWFHLV